MAGSVHNHNACSGNRKERRPIDRSGVLEQNGRLIYARSLLSSSCPTTNKATIIDVREVTWFLMISTWSVVGWDKLGCVDGVWVATETNRAFVNEGSKRSYVSVVLFSRLQRNSVSVGECDRLCRSDHVWSRQNLRYTRKMPSSFSIEIARGWTLRWIISRRPSTSCFSEVNRTNTTW